MGRGAKTATIAVGLTFALGLLLLTVSVIIDTKKIDVLTVTSLIIVFMFLFGIYGVIKEPPPR